MHMFFFFLLLSMICPLKTDSWTFMQHCKSQDFVHTIKETAHLEQLPFTILKTRAHMLLLDLITFTIIFVFLTIVTISCCIMLSAFLFHLQQTFEVSAPALPPRWALVLLVLLRPKRQGFAKS